jgi:hypothetical protein
MAHQQRDWVNSLSAISARLTPFFSRCCYYASRSARVGTKNPAWSSPVDVSPKKPVIGVVTVEHDHRLPGFVGKHPAQAAADGARPSWNEPEHGRVPGHS